MTKREIDGYTVPDDMNLELVRTVSDKLTDIAELARKADKVISDRKSTVAESMLGIARECGTLDVFNCSYHIVVARYKARHKAKKVPTVMTQTASDIRRIYSLRIDLSATNAKGEILTYSQLKSAAGKLNRDQAEKARKAEEDNLPDYLKVFNSLVEQSRDFAINRQTERYHAECAFFTDVNELLKASVKEWLEQNPVEVTDSVDAEAEGLAAQAA